MVTSVGTDCTVVGICSTEEGGTLTGGKGGPSAGVCSGSGKDFSTILLTSLSWGVSLDTTCEAIPYKEGGLPLHSLGNEMIS